MPFSPQPHHSRHASWPPSKPPACRRIVALSGLFLLLVVVFGTLQLLSAKTVQVEEQRDLDKRQFQFGGILGGAFRGVIERPVSSPSSSIEEPSPSSETSRQPPSPTDRPTLTPSGGPDHTSQIGGSSSSKSHKASSAGSELASDDRRTQLLDALAEALKTVLKVTPSPAVSASSSSQDKKFVSDIVGGRLAWPRPAGVPPSMPSLASLQPVFSSLPKSRFAESGAIAKEDVAGTRTRTPEVVPTLSFGLLGSSFKSSLSSWALHGRELSGDSRRASSEEPSLLSSLSRIVTEIYSIDPTAAARLIDTVLQTLHVDSTAIATVVPRVAKEVSVKPADMLPLIIPAVSKAMGGKVQEAAFPNPLDKIGTLNDVLSQGTNIINHLSRSTGELVDPALSSVLNQVAGIVSAAADFLNEPLCAVNQVLDGATHEVVVPCNSTAAIPIATSLAFSTPLGVGTSILENLSKTVVTLVLPSQYTSAGGPVLPSIPATATSETAGTGNGNGTPTSSAASPAGPCVACPSCQQCPPSRCSTPGPGELGGSPSPDPVAGPCPGRGYKCADCPDGWFCPPRETPAQPAPCGRGWPCYHCSSGWFCDSGASASSLPTGEATGSPTQQTGPGGGPGAPSSTSAPKDLAPGWSYLGCYQDTISRTVVGGKPADYLSGNMSKSVCINHCGSRGYRYAGTENGKDCWCGNSMREDAVVLPETQCATPCQGLEGNCGGTWAVAVYACLPGQQPPASQPASGAISGLLAALRAQDLDENRA